MRVGLIDVDSHNFPNLCLMKLSEYHTRHGDRVEWWDPAKQYDLVYKKPGIYRHLFQRHHTGEQCG